MKTARFFILAIALFASASVWAQELTRSYTDVLGNQVYEYCDRYGRISRTDTVEIDVLGNTVVTVRDSLGRIIETITYETDIFGATIITIRDAYGVIVERIKHTTDNLGRVITTITDKTGRTIRYKESRYCKAERLYSGYVKVHINLRNNKKARKPQHNIHNSRPRQDLQRPPQRPNHGNFRPNGQHKGQQNNNRAPGFGNKKPNNNGQHNNRPPQNFNKKPQPKGQVEKKNNDSTHKRAQNNGSQKKN